jgi:putative aldouronate transport system permease protein
VVTVDLRRRFGATGRRPNQGNRAFNAVNAVILTVVVCATLYPFINILARSFSEEHAIHEGRVNLLPKGFNLTTYRTVMADGTFWTNYGRTVEYTVVGTIISLVLTTIYAYVTSKKQLRGRGLLVGIAVFTLFFNGGIIPNYVLISHLHMRDTLWAIVLPNAISVFNLLVMKAFFETLPTELEEAAEVDGMNTYGILLRIVLPLSKAIIATMVLFYAVAYWNSWFSAFLYMDRQDLFPVTVYLRNLIAGATGGTNEDAATDTALQVAANIKAVTVVLTCLPILIVYPFIQRYFVTGILLGAVKE